MQKTVYADYAAATPIDKNISNIVHECEETFGNPSSIHSFGRIAADRLNKSRQVAAEFLNSSASEIFFTGSGSESNNLAIIGLAKANKEKGNHIITSAIEHPSVLNTCRSLEKEGFEVTYLPVDSSGLVNSKDFESAIRPETIFASIHIANSELGVIQPITALAKIAKNNNIILHSDACQATSYLDLNVENLGVDLLTVNSSKCYGPRGVALLYVRSGIKIFPIIFGGGQEQSLRSGTENLPAIVGFAAALELAKKNRIDEYNRIEQLRNQLQKSLETINGITINSKLADRSPNHLSVTIGNTNETNLVSALDKLGVAVSSGSACSSSTATDSHVLSAIGLTSTEINNTIRISLGRESSTKQIEYIFSVIKKLASNNN